MRARILTVIVAIGAVAGLALGLPPSGTAHAEPLPAAGSVTLLTGDRVLLRPDGSVATVEPATGREGIPMSRFGGAGHSYVVPRDAARLLGADRLDPRLFDVTLLAELGYDDGRDTLPLLVAGGHPAVRAATRALPGVGSAVAAPRDGSVWRALRAGPTTLAGGVRKVWLDGRRRVSLDESVPRIGAPAGWAAGYTGDGVTVAVLDTGVDQTHPDLAGREIAEHNFSDAPDNVDHNGHGTHVASTIASTGDPYRGVAPGARLLDAKVANDEGWATDSAIIAGMSWAAEQGARIVNLSFGADDTPGVDPVEQTVNTLSAQRGMLFVVAAGNDCVRPGVSSPASADAALAVGAVDGADAVADFSCRGPRPEDGAVKPELTAPGVDITAAKAGGDVHAGHVSMDGTSMAAPHVAGSAALLAQQHPQWTGARLKAALVVSAKPSDGFTELDQGAGRVDVAHAITETLTSEPATLTLGAVPFPHTEPAAKALTYRNDGPADLTLDLALDTHAPAGVLALSANRLTVPAGGTASVTVTGDTGAATEDGTYTGTVVATAGSLSARTPVSVYREPESYDLTVDVLGRDGRPAVDYDLILLPLDGSGARFPYDPDGSVTIRLPVGDYPVEATVRRPDSHLDVVTYPALSLTQDTRITLDARAAKPVKITPPDPAAAPEMLDLGYAIYRSPSLLNFHSTTYGDPGRVSLAHAGPALPGDRLTYWVSGQWRADTEVYDLAWFQHGRVPTGFARVVGARDAARVDTRFGAAGPGATGKRLAFPEPVGGFNRVFPYTATQSTPVDVDLPAELVTHVNADAQWVTSLWQTTVDGARLRTESPARRYRAGGHYRERLADPVFGPALPVTGYASPGASRTGDWISVEVPLFGDAAGNAGSSTVDSGRTVLYRDDEPVDEFPVPGYGQFEVPREPGDYRLETEAVRSGFDLSTEVRAAWTFRSAHVAGEAWARVPLSTVHFRPRLVDGSAPAGQRFDVPVSVVGPAGDPVRPRRLTVEASYDDGATWQAVPVTDGVARLDHPAGAGTVSLRASARLRDGTTVEQTIVRAYRLATE